MDEGAWESVEGGPGDEAPGVSGIVEFHVGEPCVLCRQPAFVALSLADGQNLPLCRECAALVVMLHDRRQYMQPDLP